MKRIELPEGLKKYPDLQEKAKELLSTKKGCCGESSIELRKLSAIALQRDKAAVQRAKIIPNSAARARQSEQRNAR